MTTSALGTDLAMAPHLGNRHSRANITTPPSNQSYSGSARHDGFTLNVLTRLPPPWTHTVQRLIGHCLIHRLHPQVTKHHTKVPIPKPDDPLNNRPITLHHDWEAFLTGWISDKMSDGLEQAHTLPPYITAYRKGKSIDDLTQNHIMFLEDTQHFSYDVSAALSDDIEKNLRPHHDGNANCRYVPTRMLRLRVCQMGD